MRKLQAFRHKETGEVHITRDADHYEDKHWEAVPVPKAAKPSAEERRRAKVFSMTSVERYDALLAEVDALRARLDKAGL